jgi:hypothetical protein
MAGFVTAKLPPVAAAGCRGSFPANDNPQALWIFSASACGSYGFSDLKISHAGRTAPFGQIELQSSGSVHVSGGSAFLLRVDASPEITAPN